MSAIQSELSKATGVKEKKGEKRPKFLSRIYEAAMELSEEDWDELEQPTQKWVNAATKATQDKEPVPEFPDLEDEESAEADSEEEEASSEDDEDSEDKDSDDDNEQEAEGDGDEEETEAEDEEPAEENEDEEGDGEAEAEAETEDEEESEVETSVKRKVAAKKAGNGKVVQLKKKPKVAAKEGKEKTVKKAAGGKTSVRRRIKLMIIKRPAITTAELIAHFKKSDESPSELTIATTRSEVLDTMRLLVDQGLMKMKM